MPRWADTGELKLGTNQFAETALSLRGTKQPAACSLLSYWLFMQDVSLSLKAKFYNCVRAHI